MTTLETYRDRPVGDVVAENYSRAAAFKTLGIDFCCGGRRTVAEACERAGVPIDEAERAIADAGRGSGTESWQNPHDWDLDLLVAWIERMHHRYVRRALPPLRQFSEKVARVHGPHHPALVEVQNLVAELAVEMDRHMSDEEDEVFPRVVALAQAKEGGASDDLRLPIRLLEDDHEHAGATMRRIRELTDNFTPPDEACATWRACYTLLEEFETDLHRHVHLENNVLFPRAAALAGHPMPSSS